MHLLTMQGWGAPSGYTCWPAAPDISWACGWDASKPGKRVDEVRRIGKDGLVHAAKELSA